MSKQLSPSAPYKPAPWEDSDVVAIKALAGGTASPAQQRHALDYIINVVCDTCGMSYRPGPDGARDSDFAEGKRFVGNQIIKLIKIDLARIKQAEKQKN